MKLKPLFAALTTLCGAMLSQQAQALDKKVLLVGIDGVQFERLEALNTPAFDRLKVNKAYTGGIAGSPSEQSTKSGPGLGHYHDRRMGQQAPGNLQRIRTGQQ